MHALPFALASLLAAALAPALLRALREGGHCRPNYRGRDLPFPFGMAIVAAALLALVPLLALQRLGKESVLVSETGAVVAYSLGVAFLGLLDDVFGGDPASGRAQASGRVQASSGDRASGSDPAFGGAQARGGGQGFGGAQARGWRGHARATLLDGRPSTGALKAAGALGLALYATSALESSTGRWLLASAVLVLATNVFNLLDLRPGRAIKGFALLGAGLALGAWNLRPLWAVGLFAGPALVAGVYDTRERAMLGDTGANLIGGLAGFWLVLALSEAGQIAALVVLAAITAYGELRSISALVERVPGLRELDSWGRPTHR